jgi:malonyl CoA-acyl carrier protein transacylase
VEVTPIPVAAAFHSALVKPAQEPLSALIEADALAADALPVYSNTTARAHAADVARVKRQMAEHLVRPVEFVAQIEAMYADGARVFVEIGPKSVLALTRLAHPGRQAARGRSRSTTAAACRACSAASASCCAPASTLDLTGAVRAPRHAASATRPSPPRSCAEPRCRKHAWLLNGSGARRAAEPVRQVGVTLEQVAGRAPPAAPPQSLHRRPPRRRPTPPWSRPAGAPRGTPDHLSHPPCMEKEAHRWMNDERQAGMADMLRHVRVFRDDAPVPGDPGASDVAYLGEAAPARPDDARPPDADGIAARRVVAPVVAPVASGRAGRRPRRCPPRRCGAVAPAPVPAPGRPMPAAVARSPAAADAARRLRRVAR